MDALTIDSLEAAFAAERYVADRDLATAVYLALTLDRPLLLEGEAGVGKTEVGRTLAAVLKTELIRLQCYEGLDVNTAVYEWDYPRQMLEIRLLEARGEAKQAATHDIFSEQCLILRRRSPALADALAREVVAFVQRLRSADLTKVPGIAETIDWAAALTALGAQRLEPEQIERTLGALLKYQEDLSALRGGGAAKLLDEVRAATR